MEKNNDMFDFIGDDIYSSSDNGKIDFEDISSSSKVPAGRYRKKRRGNKFTRWWRGCKKWQRVTMISCTSVVLVLAIAVGALRIIFN